MPRTLLAGLALIALAACGRGSHERPARAQARARVPEASKSTATKRDRQALDLLYRRHGSALYDVALGIVPDPVEARRTVAWVFRQAWRTPSLFDSALVPVSAWLVELTRTDAQSRLHNHRSNGNGKRRQAETSRDDAAQQRRAEP